MTGAKTAFTEDLALYLERCRISSILPLAVGFGIEDRQDVDFLRVKAEIAVIGSQTIRLAEEKGVEVGAFIRSLRP